MAVIDNLDVQVRAKIGDFQSNIAKAGKSVDTFKNKVTSSSGQMNALSKSFTGDSFFGGIASSAASVLGPLALFSAGIAGVIKSVSMFSTMEQNETAFGTMLGGLDQAKILMKDINKFAAETPLDTAGIIDASKTLLQFGVSGDKVINTLKMLGDAAGGDSQRFQMMSLAFGQMSSTGRLMGQDLNQMINAGFNPLKEISKMTGQSMGSLKKKMEDGAISSKMVEDAFKHATSEGGQFFGLMEAQSKTFGGKLSKVWDDIAMGATAIGEVIVKAFGLDQGLDSLGSFTSNIKAFIEEWKGPVISFGTACRTAFGLVMDGLSSLGVTWETIMFPLAGSLMSFMGPLGNWTETIKMSFFTAEWVMKNFKDVWNQVVLEAALGITTAGSDFLHMFGTVIPNIFTTFAKLSGEIFSSLTDNIGNAMGAIWDYITGDTTSLEFAWKPLAGGFEEAFADIKKSLPRELNDVEKELNEQLTKQKGKNAGGLMAFLAEKNKKTDLGTLKPGEVINTEDEAKKEKEKKKKKEKEEKATVATAPKAVEKGTAAAINEIAAIRKERDGVLAKKADVQIKALQAIERNTAEKALIANFV